MPRGLGELPFLAAFPVAYPNKNSRGRVRVSSSLLPGLKTPTGKTFASIREPLLSQRLIPLCFPQIPRGLDKGRPPLPNPWKGEIKHSSWLTGLQKSLHSILKTRVYFSFCNLLVHLPMPHPCLSPLISCDTASALLFLLFPFLQFHTNIF